MRRRPYLAAATLLLLIAAFFRLWQLGSTPPGMREEELTNAQIADRVRDGYVAVIYDDVSPAREGMYYAILAMSRTIFGSGIILWRLPSVWVSMLGLAVTAALMRQLFGGRVALFVMGLMAVAFWPVWMGRAVLHVTLVPLMSTLVAYTLTRAFRAEEGTESSLWFTVGGIALGLAQYAHVTAWTLALIFIAFVAYEWLTMRRAFRQHIGNVIYALALAIILALPLLIFLAGHPGIREPVPIEAQTNLPVSIPERLAESAAGLALRGDMSPNHNLPGRPVLGPIIGVLLIVGIGVSLQRWRRPSYMLLLLWFVIGLAPMAFLPRKPDFEYMAVILPVVFVFPAVALRTVYRLAQEHLLALRKAISLQALTGVVVFIIVGNALWTFRDYFITWPTLGDVRLNYQADVGVLAHYLDTSRDPTPVSICATPVNREKRPFALRNDELLGYLMHRRGLPLRYFDCTQSLVLAEGGNTQRLIFPRGHYYDYLPGPLLAWLRTARSEEVPGVRPDVIMRLAVSRELADTAGAFITTAPTAWPPEAGGELAALPVTFSDSIAFLGYEVRDDTISSTDWIELTTYWRMDGPPPRDLRLFAHMLGSPVVVIAQDDRLGVQIATLQPRDVFLQYSLIQTRGGMTPGMYALSVGLYVPHSGQRLQAYVNGEPRADRLFLQRVTVEP